MDQKIKENLQNQLMELEILQSVYSQPGEIRLDDYLILHDMKRYVNGEIEETPPYLDFTINLQIVDAKFEFCVGLSTDYPVTKPEIFVRSHKLSNSQHRNLNRDLKIFVKTIEEGEPCVFAAITWLQDNADKYISNQEIPETIKKDTGFLRYWIYSHHIYSKTKRKEIVDLANDMNLSGFCMPGRPGIICVEGAQQDCIEWWQIIKSMSWKKIVCKITEECKNGDVDFLKFKDFSEVMFQNNSIKCAHMDMGGLYKFLDEHKCSYAFKEIFGVEPSGC